MSDKTSDYPIKFSEMKRHTRNHRLSMAAAVVLVLAGCDRAEAVPDAARNPERPAIVISPGMTFDDHGRPGRVFGQDACSREEQSAGSKTRCIVINSVTKQVNVIVASAATPSGHPETWTVVRTGASPESMVWLRCPDGSYVSRLPGE
ncbi:hypothetical protein QNH99_23390 (plasmid) [Pantoea allii]|uniref:hypothetical protein n=1 Tax=Pantoea allii TaxID=574096 RepID=UPI003977B500